MFFKPLRLFSFCVIVFFSLGSVNSSAQKIADVYLNFENLNDTHGLNSQLINQVFQDSHGFIWLSTWEGLIRYDGFTFKEFRHKEGEKNSPLTNSPVSITESTDGQLWISYTPAGLDRFDPVLERFFHYENTADPKSLPDKPARKMFLDSKNNVWLGFTSGSSKGTSFYDPKVLMKFDPSSGLGEKYGPLPLDEILPKEVSESQSLTWREQYNSIYDITEDKNGTFWISAAGGLYKFNGSNFTLADTGGTTQLLYDKDNDNLWFGSIGALGLLNINEKKISKFKSIPMLNGVASMAWKSKDEIWICTGFNLLIFNVKNLNFTRVLTSQGNPIAAYHVYVDFQGNTYVAHKGGLSIWRTSSDIFKFQRMDIHLGGNYLPAISDFHKDKASGEYFIAASWVDTVYSFNPKNSVTTKYLPPYDKSNTDHLYVNDLVEDHEGNTWIVCRNYIFKYNSSKKRLEKLDLQIKVPRFFTAVFDKQGTLWVGSSRNGIYKINTKTSQVINYNRRTSPSIPDYYYSSIIDTKGRIWFLTSGDGIVLVDPVSDKFHIMKNDPQKPTSLSSNLVNSIVIGEQGDIYVGTSNGINVHRPQDSIGTFHKMNTGDYSFNSICEEEKDIIWYSTTNAVCRYNIKQNSIRRFTKRQGLSGTYIDMTLSKIDDKILIGSEGGFYKYELNKPYDSVKRFFKIAITSVKIDDKELILEQELNEHQALIVNPGEKTIQFEFSGLDNSEPDRLEYYYQLEKFNKDWVRADKNRTAVFSNLREGKYYFKVSYRVTNSNVTSTISIPIVVKVPFYTTSFFLISVIIAGFIITLFIFVVYLRFIRARHTKEKEYNDRIAELQMSSLRAQINPHFLFNSLNSVNRFILKHDSVAANNYLTKFSKLIRSILENVSAKFTTIEEEIALIKTFVDLEKIRLEEKFDYSIELDGDIDSSYLKIPTMIIQPYVENAIWHGLTPKASGGMLKIKFSKIEDILQITIEDNGVGRNATKKTKSSEYRKSLGHKITEERLQLMSKLYHQKAEVHIIDLKDEFGSPAGTRVIIILGISN